MYIYIEVILWLLIAIYLEVNETVLFRILLEIAVVKIAEQLRYFHWAAGVETRWLVVAVGQGYRACASPSQLPARPTTVRGLFVGLH